MTAAQLRALVSKGIERDIDALRRQRSALRALDFLTFVGLWVVGVAAVAFGSTLRGWERPASIALGAVLCTLAFNVWILFLHEGFHDLLSISRTRSRVATALFAVPFLFGPTSYRVLHLRHHRHLGTLDDPDDYRRYARTPLGVRRLEWLRLTVGSFAYIVAMPILCWPFARARDRAWLLAEYGLVLSIAIPAFAVLPLPLILWAWVVPAALAGLSTNVRAVAQHQLLDTSDAALCARTVRLSPLVAFFLLNENFHLEHHLWPDVPSYNLPALHRLIWRRLPRAVSTRSYLAVAAAFVVGREGVVDLVEPAREAALATATSETT